MEAATPCLQGLQVSDIRQSFLKVVPLQIGYVGKIGNGNGISGAIIGQMMGKIHEGMSISVFTSFFMLVRRTPCSGPVIPGAEVFSEILLSPDDI
jgi:hypothetical protein